MSIPIGIIKSICNRSFLILLQFTKFSFGLEP